MKKLITLVILIFGTQLLFAQSPDFNSFNFNKRGQVTLNKNINAKTFHKNSKGTTRWYNYGETMDTVLGGGLYSLHANWLFPDSTIIAYFGQGSYANPWIHGLGDVLDVSSMNFNDPNVATGQLYMNKTSTFNVDSLGIYILYERHLDTSIVDTLVFELSVNNALPYGRFINSPVSTNLSTDTVYFRQLSYSYLTNSLNLTGKKIYKFPLTHQVLQDTLPNGLSYIEISTADLPTVNAGKYVATSVRFIPGYTWTPNVDTLDYKNSVTFISFKEQDNAYPYYTKRDYNVSYIIPIDVRYNYAGSWNGNHIPMFAYMGGSDPSTYPPYDHHLIYYLVNCQTNCGNVSNNDIDKNNPVQLGDAYPNPVGAGSEIIIPFSLNNSDLNSSISICNPIGQVLKNYNYTNYVPGEYQTTINTSNLKAGLYFYILRTSNGAITKTFTIQ